KCPLSIHQDAGRKRPPCDRTLPPLPPSLRGAYNPPLARGSPRGKSCWRTPRMETSMISRSFAALLSCLLAFALAGCSNSGGGSGGTQIRVVNAVPDAAAISVIVGSTTVVSNLAFQGLTLYTGVDSGSQEFKVSANGGASNAIDTMLNLNSNANYTYVV